MQGITLKKLFSRSSLYDIPCFSIIANGPHLVATITPDNISKRSCIDAIIYIYVHLL